MKNKIALFFASLILLSCGKDNGSKISPANNTFNEETKETCQLYFKSQDLCASIQWKIGPTADEDSSFDLKLWKKTGGSVKGPFTEPLGQTTSFLRMNCCGTISNPKIAKVADGQYSVTKARFMPGKWEVYVQLKKGDDVEKQFIKVEIKD